MREFKEYATARGVSIVVEWRISQTGYEHRPVITVDGWQIEDVPVIRHRPPIKRSDGVVEPGGWWLWDRQDGVIENLRFALGGRAQGDLGATVTEILLERLEQLQGAPHPVKPDRPVRLAEHPEWLFFARDCQEGVLIDPRLPMELEDLRGLHLEDCPPVIRERWWNRPFVVTSALSDQLESYESASARMHRRGSELRHPRDVWDKRQQSLAEAWVELYPSGLAYEVWVIGTGPEGEKVSVGELGSFSSLDEAIRCATQMHPK